MTEPTPAAPDPVQQALALFQQQRLAEALPLLEQLVEAGNTPLLCVLALAEARESTGNSAGAIRLLENLYQALPQEDFAVALVAALLRAGRREPLALWLPRVLAAHPASTRLQAMQGEFLLKCGDFARGFALLPLRGALVRETLLTTALPCPVWDGQPFAGTLLVGTEQGLGDVVLWSSLFTELAACGQPALIACDARLLALFRRSFPTLTFADRARSPLTAPGQCADNRKIETQDMAPLFQRQQPLVRPAPAWLQADPERVAALRETYRARFPGQRLIGVSWRSHRFLRGETKSIPVADLAPLFRLPNTVLVSLQYGDITPDLQELAAAGLQLQVDPAINMTDDIDGVCALAAALDGVVSSSTTIAHLAGALGLPTRVMVPGERYVLWYWGYDGDAAPWYRSARIFRGPPRLSWPALAAQVAADFPESAR